MAETRYDMIGADYSRTDRALHGGLVEARIPTPRMHSDADAVEHEECMRLEPLVALAC